MDSGVFRRSAGVLVVVIALAGVMAGSVGAAAAQPTIDVTVDGDAVSDGEQVTVGSSPKVNVSVDSTTELNYVDVTMDGRTIGEGVDEGGFDLTHTPDFGFGTTRYVVRATDEDGQTAKQEVLLERPAETPEEIRAQLNRIERELEDLQAQNEVLEDRRENLSAENERLRSQLNETEGEDEASQPGFGAAVAVLSAVTVGVYRRR